MKMIYDKKLNAVLDPANMFIGDVDPLMNTSKQVAEILLQNRPLVQKDVETEEKCEGALPRPEQFGVWICYITDNYGDPIMVKLVSTDVQAMAWVTSKLRPVGVMEDETRGVRSVEYPTVEVER